MPLELKFGVSPPMHGRFPEDRPDFFKRIALLAERGGFDSLWVEDHFRLPASEIRANEGEPGKDDPLEAWTTLAAVAAWTNRIKLGTEVTPLPLRHPSVLAKMVTTVDVLSKGRVILGAGAGWHKVEFESFGIGWEKRERRFARMTEGIEIIKSLWTEPVVDYDGRFYKLKNAWLAPKPVQKPHPPIWFGGFSDRILKAVIKYGDGWINATNVSPKFVEEGLNRLKAFAREAGRDPGEIEAVVPFMTHVAKNRETARRSVEGYIKRAKFGKFLGEFFAEGLRRYGLWGTSKDCISKMEKYVKIGIKYFIFDVRPASVSLDSLTLLSEEVVPHFIKR